VTHKKDFLSGQRINPIRPGDHARRSPDRRTFLAYNGGRLAEGLPLYSEKCCRPT